MLTGAIALSLLSLNVHALSVGKMNIESYLGEPLDISIDVKSVSKSELSTLEVSLASHQLFTQAGIQYPENADSINVELDSSKENNTRILVTSRNSITNPFVHLLLRISWSGGNMLREYTALIDPADYKTSAIAKATSPTTRLGVVRAPAVAPEPTTVAATGGSADPRYHPAVKAGESLSAIASLYRPADVSAQQSWIAFFNLNPKAFPGGNINNLSKGARLQIPSAEQMRAVSRDEARNQVANLTRPLTPATAKLAEKTPETAPGKTMPVAQPAPKAAPTLVVGGSAGANANAAPAQMPASTGAANAENLSVSDLQGYDQITSGIANINQELQDSREQSNQVKQELAATRGENRALNERLSQLEVQLGKMNQLLELQSQALQNLSANRLGGVPTDTAAAPTAIQPAAAPVAVVPAPQPVAPQVAEPVADTAGTADTPDEEKTYYEQLLGSAISEAPDADKQYIEAIEKQSSTAIGKPDAMPVTDEMERAATAKPDMPEMPADQQTMAMMDDVRASLQSLRASTGGTLAADSPAGATAVPPVDLKISPQDEEFVAALSNEGQLSEIDRLEQELELRKQAVRDAAAATEAAKSAEQAARDAAPAVTRVAAPEQGFMGTIKGLGASFMDDVSSLLGGIGSDIWKLLGGIGVALLSLMLVVGLRKNRRESDDSTSEILPGSDMSSVNEEDVDEISNFAMSNVSDSSIEDDGELHGSSMFDLSDESFMASEAIQDDSSLFSMDDDNSDMDSLGDMDSIGHQQSALAAVDVDPVAEAEVYLAYDRQEQAIEVLEQALQQNPNQGAVVAKLLGLYQAADNKQAFSDLFSASSGQIDDDAEWDSIKRMAKDVVPEHELLADDFDSSIPVLMDEMPEAGGDELAISDEEDLFLAAAQNLDKLDAESTEEFNKKQGNEGGISLSLADESDEDALTALSSSSLELDEDLDSAMQEVNQHDPDTALALAKAYIELGENDIAKDFLNDAINAGSDETKAEAEAALAAMG